jgi:hypothetical protein
MFKEKPYSFTQKRFFMFYYKFEILYKESPIYTIIGGFKYYEDVKSITAMLNGSYFEGRLDESRECLGFEKGSEKWLDAFRKK